MRERYDIKPLVPQKLEVPLNPTTFSDLPETRRDDLLPNEGWIKLSRDNCRCTIGPRAVKRVQIDYEGRISD